MSRGGEVTSELRMGAGLVDRARAGESGSTRVAGKQAVPGRGVKLGVTGGWRKLLGPQGEAGEREKAGEGVVG